LRFPFLAFFRVNLCSLIGHGFAPISREFLTTATLLLPSALYFLPRPHLQFTASRICPQSSRFGVAHINLEGFSRQSSHNNSIAMRNTGEEIANASAVRNTGEVERKSARAEKQEEARAEVRPSDGVNLSFSEYKGDYHLIRGSIRGERGLSSSHRDSAAALCRFHVWLSELESLKSDVCCHTRAFPGYRHIQN
jgi:hypothetical protein